MIDDENNHSSSEFQHSHSKTLLQLSSALPSQRYAHFHST